MSSPGGLFPPQMPCFPHVTCEKLWDSSQKLFKEQSYSSWKLLCLRSKVQHLWVTFQLALNSFLASLFHRLNNPLWSSHDLTLGSGKGFIHWTTVCLTRPLLDLKKNATELILKTVLEASGWCVLMGLTFYIRVWGPGKLYHPCNPNERLLSILSSL